MEWDPTQFFRSEDAPNPYVLVVLNQPINEKAFAVLKSHACATVCADGGANRYYDMMKAQGGRESTDLPSLIIGDLDSIKPSVKDHYANLNVPIHHDPDQYSTDFTKCLNYIRTHADEIIDAAQKCHPLVISQDHPRALDILILGGLGGRVDQAFSQIHHLYLMAQELQRQQHENESIPGELYLISEESITFILRAGQNIIRTPGANRPRSESEGPSTQSNPQSHLLEENIGIIPLTGPARITTSGFEWDVEDWATEIGGQISTSNHIRAEEVKVETRGSVLFTLELAERFKRGR